MAVCDMTPKGLHQLALTGLRNIIGQHDLDEVLQERDKINDLLRQSIEDSTVQLGNRMMAGNPAALDLHEMQRKDSACRVLPSRGATATPILRRPRSMHDPEIHYILYSAGSKELLCPGPDVL